MTIVTTPNSPAEIQPLLLDVSTTTLTVTPEQFVSLCLKNPDLRLELNPNRELIVMVPTLPISGKRNGDLSGQVWYWNRQTELGEAFDSSTGYDFTAVEGGMPSPDSSWIEKSRLEGVSLEKFFSIAPDFVIELRSTSDDLKPTQQKMLVYQRVGVRMGLLINPQNKQVEIYRPGQAVEILAAPQSIDCNEVMPGFILDMSRIW
ncbi:Uma2 family endonuclease [Chamaesiphon sp. OTE_75_metabat_556]|uniref:Uma2 family endonuclease n=1 Tax=Chamaesiphon sp. OTE_75_metabat_556 TaxID=2964692 RepID=UPI00286B3A31|nr:Uma2 family endonuclease [Chamaesiphon sp. OTE_75_metabat_556]